MIYLDSAATTLEKPASVRTAMLNAMRSCASPGRGGHRAAERAAQVVYRCRNVATELFDVPSPEQVVLTFNATHGLNIAIRTLVKPGGVVLISGYEHNAVTRVLHSIPGIEVRVAAGRLFDPEDCVRNFETALTENVGVVICNHVSNVFGFIQPIDRIAALCSERGIPLIVDASQSAGVLPVSLNKWKAAFVAMPGHKGLYGPQGTGLLLCGTEPKPLLYGGTGSSSIKQDMPEYLPDLLEAGTQNVWGAAGLAAGMEFVARVGIEKISRYERTMCSRVKSGLKRLPGIRVLEGADQCGLFSFVVDGVDCERVGELLNEYDIAVRSGLHCAPLAHKTGGTLDTGTVRMSFSIFNRREQLKPVLLSMRKICETRGAR